jgi:23S rRNA (uracil1939-C5)-methyltransferase
VATDEKIEQSPALGFHAPGAFDKVVDVNKCHLQDDLSNEIRNFTRTYTKEHGMEYYDARAHTGLMRNMVVRNTSLGHWMIIMSFAKEDDRIMPFLEVLKDKFPQISSLHYVINKKLNDTILDQDIILYHGEPFIIEQLGDIKYKIGPKSFFQTNTAQANVLFETVVDFAELKGDENIYDLYTGLGSIALYVSKSASHVTGIEEVEAAIIDAKENARLNGIENTTFYAGDVKDILTDDFSTKHGHPDLVITDPPRVGMHKDVIETLLKLKAPKVLYVSCNPATQARDLELLSAKYETVRMQPVDMFPHTHHIENVALLVLK